MTVRPILFSEPMVLALLRGHKTQTRRILKPQPEWFEQRGCISEGWAWEKAPGKWCLDGWKDAEKFAEALVQFVPYAVGDLLYVRETWAKDDRLPNGVRYYATDAVHELRKKRPGIHMPRSASRLTLKVTDVIVQRIQDISELDAVAEGASQYSSSIKLYRDRPYDPSLNGFYREGFSELWEGLNAKRGYGWDANPWVVAAAFTVHKMNVDQFLAMEAA
jgi:hypothetical protein